MARAERTRWELRDLLKEHLGMDVTDALLDELPPIGDELATKADIAEFRKEHRRDITELRLEWKRDLAETRSSLLTATVGSVIAMYAATLGTVVALVTLR